MVTTTSESVYLQDLHAIQFKEAWTKEKKPLKATIGLLDQPELQSQTPLTLDISKDGHVAVSQVQATENQHSYNQSLWM